MGIPLLKMEAEMTGGSFEIESDLNQGNESDSNLHYNAFGYCLWAILTPLYGY